MSVIGAGKTRFESAETSVTLSEAQLDQLADRIADRLRSAAPCGRQLVDAQTLADELGVRRETIYAHADEFGAIRLGDGPKPRLRFDLETARAAFTCYVSKRSQGSDASTGAKSDAARTKRVRRLPNRLPEPGSILAVRPRERGA
jgi:hypothetical protein